MLKYNKTNLVTAVLAAALFLMPVSAFANGGDKKCQTKNDSEELISEKTINNLAMAIKSENDGLKRSAVYLAALYDIEELSGTIVNELKNEKNADTKILMALTLYKIGNKESIEAVDNLLLYNGNIKARTLGEVRSNLFESSPVPAISSKE